MGCIKARASFVPFRLARTTNFNFYIYLMMVCSGSLVHIGFLDNGRNRVLRTLC
jgi:hypothetical protein